MDHFVDPHNHFNLHLRSSEHHDKNYFVLNGRQDHDSQKNDHLLNGHNQRFNRDEFNFNHSSKNLKPMVCSSRHQLVWLFWLNVIVRFPPFLAVYPSSTYSGIFLSSFILILPWRWLYIKFFHLFSVHSASSLSHIYFTRPRESRWIHL